MTGGGNAEKGRIGGYGEVWRCSIGEGAGHMTVGGRAHIASSSSNNKHLNECQVSDTDVHRRAKMKPTQTLIREYES